MAQVTRVVTLTETFTRTYKALSPTIVGETNYIPIVTTTTPYDQSTFTVTPVEGSVGSDSLSGSVGILDSVLVGDIVVSSTVGTFTAKSTVTLTDFITFDGLPFIIYPLGFNSSTIRIGDTISGTGIPVIGGGVDTIVESIDVATRRVFIANKNTGVGVNCTATGTQSLTLAPPVRVVTVSKSTASTNPNSLTIDSTVATTVTAGEVTISRGIQELPVCVFRITPGNSTTNNLLPVAIADTGANGLSGVTLDASRTLGGLNVVNLVYANFSTRSFDINSQLTNLGFPVN